MAPPDVPIEDRRRLLDSASEIVNAVAPDLIEQRRREVEEQRRRDRRALEVLAPLVAVEVGWAPL